MNELPLAERIYRAQCFGNVEPIEYMVPYPNIGSLLEGQVIKIGNKPLYPDEGLSYHDFHMQVLKVANWLTLNRLEPHDRVLIQNIQFPMAEIFAFAVWTAGASLIILDSNYNKRTLSLAQPKMVLDGPEIMEKVDFESLETVFSPQSKALLMNEALVFISGSRGIRLSHYNLLVNASGALHELNLTELSRIQISLLPNSTTWAVLQAILPLYSGASITTDHPDITFVSNSFNDLSESEIALDYNWKTMKECNNPQQMFIVPEATAFLALGKKPNRLTEIDHLAQQIAIRGHSVMMGYLDDKMNDRIFHDNAMILSQ
jgi:acyl-CoA synthetase (AMP-forming)/AMP-acid ligase II